MNAKDARIIALHGIADLIESTSDAGEVWFYEDTDGNELSNDEGRKVIQEGLKVADAMRRRAWRLEDAKTPFDKAAEST